MTRLQGDYKKGNTGVFRAVLETETTVSRRKRTGDTLKVLSIDQCIALLNDVSLLLYCYHNGCKVRCSDILLNLIGL